MSRTATNIALLDSAEDELGAPWVLIPTNRQGVPSRGDRAVWRTIGTQPVWKRHACELIRQDVRATTRGHALDVVAVSVYDAMRGAEMRAALTELVATIDTPEFHRAVVRARRVLGMSIGASV